MTNSPIFDLAILGGGPAGSAGAVYAARKKLRTVLITDTFGGQSVVSEQIYNWIGTPTISGPELAKAFETHVRQYPDDITIVQAQVSNIDQAENVFSITTSSTTIQAKAVLYALGSNRKRLTAIDADKFEHKGLTYCASCDGPVFSGTDVVVVGGGNAGFESALQLLAYCKSVTLLHRSSEFKADAVTIEAAHARPNFRSLRNVTITQVHGDVFVNGISFTTPESPTPTLLPASGIFVEIGQLPNTEPLTKLHNKGVAILDNQNKVIIDPTTNKTALPGLWAAGDCTTVLYHQNNIAAGDGVRALEDLYLWLKRQSFQSS